MAKHLTKEEKRQLKQEILNELKLEKQFIGMYFAKKKEVSQSLISMMLKYDNELKEALRLNKEAYFNKLKQIMLDKLPNGISLKEIAKQENTSESNLNKIINNDNELRKKLRLFRKTALTKDEEINLKREILEETNNGSFILTDFCKKRNLHNSTIYTFINKDNELRRAYEPYKGLKSKKSKTTTQDFNVKQDFNNQKTTSEKQAEKYEEEILREFNEDKNTAVITTKSLNIKTLEEALKVAEVDLKIWEVDKHVINSWEVTIGGHHTGTNKSETYTNFQIKIWLKRKEPAKIGLEDLYEKIKNISPIIPIIKRPIIGNIQKSKQHRQLELSLIDIHLGMRSFKPAADIDWTPDDAEIMAMMMLDELIKLADTFGPFEKIIFPMGHDYLHTDNVYNTTTSFTAQPEADAWKSSFLRGELLGLTMVERMKEIAPVKIISVPGNHARHSEIALARILAAYYHNDANIEVDSSMSPYKFHLYGVNLIGFEHGHSIRQQVRLAALMANECRLTGWQEARYCEWHLGDQHRKGSGKPMMFEEQGVSVEFLPGLVPPNEWHRIHSFNWQKRAGMGFVWDKTAGPIARFQVNIDNYTGQIMR